MKASKSAIFRVMGILCTVLLTACDQPISLPQYWLCHGLSTQHVYDQQSVLLEKYTGEDPMMLERFGQTMYQFLSPAYSGEYRICSQSPPNDILLLKSGSCVERQESIKDSAVPHRTASFNIKTGDLTIGELRTADKKSIISEGEYRCQYLGNSFSFNDFNHVQN